MHRTIRRASIIEKQRVEEEAKPSGVQTKSPSLLAHICMSETTVFTYFLKTKLNKKLLCRNRQVRSTRESASPKLAIHGCPAQYHKPRTNYNVEKCADRKLQIWILQTKHNMYHAYKPKSIDLI